MGENSLFDRASDQLNLGKKCYSERDFNSAQTHWFNALKLTRGVAGLEVLQFESLSQLAYMQSLMGDHDKAQPLFDDASELLAKGIAVDERYRAAFFANLAIHHAGRSDFEQSYAAYVQADAAFSHAGTPADESYGDFLLGFARAAESAARHKHAQNLYARSLSVFESLFGPDHFKTRMVRGSYGKAAQRADLELKETPTAEDQRLEEQFAPGQKSSSERHCPGA